MKFTAVKILSVLALLVGAQSVRAEDPSQLPEVANCWIESGMDIEDGSFIVSVDTDKLTKKQLLTLMDRLKGQNISPVAYPLIFDKTMFITVQAVDHGFGAAALPRDVLKQRVYEQLIAALTYGAKKLDYGTAAACNHRAYPAPAVGIRN